MNASGEVLDSSKVSEGYGKKVTGRGGYPGIGQGYDMMTLNALGLSESAVREFLKTRPQFHPYCANEK